MGHLHKHRRTKNLGGLKQFCGNEYPNVTNFCSTRGAKAPPLSPPLLYLWTLGTEKLQQAKSQETLCLLEQLLKLWYASLYFVYIRLQNEDEDNDRHLFFYSILMTTFQLIIKGDK